jgi:hypothetical protein
MPNRWWSGSTGQPGGGETEGELAEGDFVAVTNPQPHGSRE